MLVFSYFLFYEYAIISRYYILIVLGAFGVCALYPYRDKILLPIAFILALLANTGAYGLIFVIAFAAVLAMEPTIKELWKLNRFKMTLGILMVALGAFLALWQMIPASDHTNPIAWQMGHKWHKHLMNVVGAVWRSYVPIPEVERHFWGSNFLMTRGALKTIAQALSLAMLIYFLNLLRRFRIPLFFFTLASFLFFLFTFFIHFGYLRHWGMLFLILISSLWLAAYDGLKPAQSRVFNVILLSQMFAGFFSYGMDIVYPFSAAHQAASWLKGHAKGDAFLAGYPDFAMTPIAGILKRPIYFFENGRAGFYEIYNSERKSLTLQSALEKLDQLQTKFSGDIFFIVSIQRGLNPLASARHWKLAASFAQSIVEDESYFIYARSELKQN